MTTFLVPRMNGQGRCYENSFNANDGLDILMFLGRSQTTPQKKKRCSRQLMRSRNSPTTRGQGVGHEESIARIGCILRAEHSFLLRTVENFQRIALLGRPDRRGDFRILSTKPRLKTTSLKRGGDIANSRMRETLLSCNIY